MTLCNDSFYNQPVNPPRQLCPFRPSGTAVLFTYFYFPGAWTWKVCLLPVSCFEADSRDRAAAGCRWLSTKICRKWEVLAGGLEISPECSLEGLMLKLKLQYFGHLIQRSDSLEKTLILGKIEGRRRGRQKWDSWEKRWDRWDSDGITDSMDMRLSRLWETVRTGRTGVLQSMGSQRVRHDWVTEQQRQQHKLWSCNTEFPGNHHLLLARHYSAHVNCIVFFLTLFISST